MVVSGNATIAGDMLSVTGLGTVKVQAAQEGNLQYAPAFSGLVSFDVEENTGIEQEFAKQVSIYPNPASNSVMVSMPDSGEKQIRIVDLIGKTYRHYIVFGKEVSLKTDDLSNGLYFIQITSKNISIAKKLVVKHR